MIRSLLLAACFMSSAALADLRLLIDEATLKQVAAETSGVEAKRNLDFITLKHRMRSGHQFDEATDHVLQRLKSYGLDEVTTAEFAADGRTMYGTQRSRPLWEVEFAELWELGDKDGETIRVRRLADWEAAPLGLAQDSLSGEATASLIDIGAGTTDADYAGKDVRGKLVLTSSQPGSVVERAVGELGAVGIVSYAPNQRSAWWREDDRLVRWGHLSSFPTTPSFGFMISLGEARKLQARLASGEDIRLHAKVEARHTMGKYRFAEAAITGADPAKRDEEILFTCHLDHPRPGANDNASGCVSILEVARTLNALINSKRVARPARTIRFLWPAEIEGSIMYLTEHDDPSRIKANIHMDMVGGGPVTKSVFRISGGPASLPTFISDIGFEIGRFVNKETEAFASGNATAFPLNSPEGGKEPSMALLEGLDMGSDHDVFREGSFRIPGLYLHDWPDRYIHTNFDLAANIDPTKLKRAAFIGAVTALILADLGDDNVSEITALLRRNALSRSAELLERIEPLSTADAAAVAHIHFDIERDKLASINDFADAEEVDRYGTLVFLASLQALVEIPAAEPETTDDTVFVRNPGIRGPMHAFGFSYINDELGAAKYAALRLPKYSGSHGSGGQYIYEALNLVNGNRTVSEIRNWLTAELGPVPIEIVREYLDALAEIDVVRVRN
jgi:aminopeptidase YwaD